MAGAVRVAAYGGAGVFRGCRRLFELGASDVGAPNRLNHRHQKLQAQPPLARLVSGAHRLRLCTPFTHPANSPERQLLAYATQQPPSHRAPLRALFPLPLAMAVLRPDGRTGFFGTRLTHCSFHFRSGFYHETARAVDFRHVVKSTFMADTPHAPIQRELHPYRTSSET